MIDNAVRLRVESVASFTDIEHYTVYRGSDEMHPVAQMTVRDSYQRGHGKTYTILTESGSSLVIKLGLRPLLEHERAINQPDQVAYSWLTSANYVMKLQSGRQSVNGSSCYALKMSPRKKAPNLVDGTMWVDAGDGTLVRIEGTASKSPSPFAGTTHMRRDYTNIDGFAMATHARAESKSFLFGRTVVVIDYSEYRIQTRAR